MKKFALIALAPLALFAACKLNPIVQPDADAGMTSQDASNDTNSFDGGAADADADAIEVDASPTPIDECFAAVSVPGALPPDASEGDQPFYGCLSLSPRCLWLPHCKEVSPNRLRNGICVTARAFNYEACRCGPGERCVGVSTEDGRTALDSGVCRVAYLCVSKTCFADAGWPLDCTNAPAPY